MEDDDDLFHDRRHAGRLLAAATAGLRDLPRLVVIGLPRGGVPVAAEVARELNAPLDVLVVRKLGVPRQPELAFGAVAGSTALVLNDDVVRATGLTAGEIEAVVRRERAEIERRTRLWRATHPPLDVAGCSVVVVDDGLATGATMRVAVRLLRQQGAGRIIVAVPVAPPQTVDQLAAEADQVICLHAPRGFFGVGQFYDDFAQLDDDDVLAVLDAAPRQPGSPEGG